MSSGRADFRLFTGLGENSSLRDEFIVRILDFYFLAKYSILSVDGIKDLNLII